MKKARRQQADKNASGRGGWVKKTLAQIGDISSAGVDKKIVAGEKEVVLLNYLDVYRRDKIYASELTHKVTAPHAKAQKCAVKKGDIFFTPSSEIRVDIAHSAVAMEDIKNGVYSYHIIRLRPKIKIDLLFSAYAFKARGFCKQAAKHACGAGQRYVISQENFRRMEVYLPSFSVQKRIGEVLHTCDDAIEKTEALIAAKERQFIGLVKKVYRQIKDSNAEKTPLSKYMQLTSRTHGRRNVVIAAVGKTGLRDRSEIYSKDLSKDYSKNKLVFQDEIVFGLASDRIVYGVNLSSKIYSVSPAYKTFKIVNCEGAFLKYLLDANNAQLSLKYLIVSARQGKAVDFESLLKELFHFPSILKQKHIAKTLSAARQEIVLLKKLAEKYRLQKRGLMQKLLSE